MLAVRRSRPTIRSLVHDLGLELPALDVDLGTVKHLLIDELRRLAPTSPKGQKRILSIDHPLGYRLRVSTYRGATWVDERDEGERVIVWLCAAHRREAGSDDDAYTYFASLHTSRELLPDDDDRLRDRAEAAIRLQRGLTTDLLRLFDLAVLHRGTEERADLGSWLPVRILVLQQEGVEEIWCALSVRGTDDSFIPAAVRDLLFVSLEDHVSPALFEARDDWPVGDIEWFEVVRLGMR
jgi:hypothetical protein